MWSALCRTRLERDFAPDLVVSDKVAFPDDRVEFYHTPGHTPDSASRTPIPYAQAPNLATYISMCEGFRRLNPAAYVAGHGRRFPRELVEANLAYLRQLAAGEEVVTSGWADPLALTPRYAHEYDRTRRGGNQMGDEQNDKRNHDQEHVHEFLGSVIVAAEPRGDLHNHRFAGVSSEADYTDDQHVHKLKTRTDFYEDHFHKIKVFTGEAIPVFDENCVEIGHVHGASGTTTVVDNHAHDFKVATLIENPIGETEASDLALQKHPKKEAPKG